MIYSIINPELIKNNMYGDVHILKQFIALYLEQTPKDIAAIDLSYSQRDQEALRKAAHHIKPTLQYIGALALGEQIKELEELAKRKENWDTIDILVTSIRPKLIHMLEELQVFNTSLI